MKRHKIKKDKMPMVFGGLIVVLSLFLLCADAMYISAQFATDVTPDQQTTPPADPCPTDPSISRLHVGGIGLNSATVTWETNVNTTGRLYYGLTQEYELGSLSQTKSTTSFSFSLSGLERETKYYIRAIVYDQCENSDSATSSFETADAHPPEFFNVRATDVTETSATIRWTTNEPATSRVEYGTSRAYGNVAFTDVRYRIASADLQLAAAYVTSHVVTISGLDPGTDYYYKATSEDEWGNSSSYEGSFGTAGEAETVPMFVPAEPPPTEEPPPPPPPSAPAVPAPAAPAAPSAPAPAEPEPEPEPEEEIVPEFVPAQEPESEAPVAAPTASIEENPDKSFKEQVVATMKNTIVLASILNLIILFTSFDLLKFLHYLLHLPMIWATRKKASGFGVVYNSISKTPIDLAIIRLKNAEGRIVQSKVTGKEGRYFFLAEPGEYELQVVKRPFTFPSSIIGKAGSDGAFSQIYNGGKLKINKSQTIYSNLPIDPTQQDKYHKPGTILLKKWLRVFEMGLAVFAVALSVAIVILDPGAFSVTIFVAEFAILLLAMRLAFITAPANRGIIKDAKSGEAINRAIVRIFETKYNKLLETALTNSKGKYHFLLGSNEYLATFEKPGYKKETQNIDFKGADKPKPFAKNIKLKKN